MPDLRPESLLAPSTPPSRGGTVLAVLISLWAAGWAATGLTGPSPWVGGLGLASVGLGWGFAAARGRSQPERALFALVGLIGWAVAAGLTTPVVLWNSSGAAPLARVLPALLLSWLLLGLTALALARRRVWQRVVVVLLGLAGLAPWALGVFDGLELPAILWTSGGVGGWVAGATGLVLAITALAASVRQGATALPLLLAALALPAGVEWGGWTAAQPVFTPPAGPTPTPTPRRGFPFEGYGPGERPTPTPTPSARPTPSATRRPVPQPLVLPASDFPCGRSVTPGRALDDLAWIYRPERWRDSALEVLRRRYPDAHWLIGALPAGVRFDQLMAGREADFGLMVAGLPDAVADSVGEVARARGVRWLVSRQEPRPDSGGPLADALDEVDRHTWGLLTAVAVVDQLETPIPARDRLLLALNGLKAAWQPEPDGEAGEGTAPRPTPTSAPLELSEAQRADAQLLYQRALCGLRLAAPEPLLGVEALQFEADLTF